MVGESCDFWIRLAVVRPHLTKRKWCLAVMGQRDIARVHDLPFTVKLRENTYYTLIAGRCRLTLITCNYWWAPELRCRTFENAQMGFSLVFDFSVLFVRLRLPLNVRSHIPKLITRMDGTVCECWLHTTVFQVISQKVRFVDLLCHLMSGCQSSLGNV